MLAPAPAAAPAKASPAASAPAPSPAGPLWAGTQGWLELSLARIVYAPGLEVTNTTGRLGLSRDQATLEKLKTVLGTGGRLQFDGLLRWLEASRSYQLGAEVGAVGLATGPLLKALNPAAGVPVEGTFGLNATLEGAGADPGAAAAGAAAEVKITGRQGVIRALNLETNRYAKIAGSKSSVPSPASSARWPGIMPSGGVPSRWRPPTPSPAPSPASPTMSSRSTPAEARMAPSPSIPSAFPPPSYG